MQWLEMEQFIRAKLEEILTKAGWAKADTWRWRKDKMSVGCYVEGYRKGGSREQIGFLVKVDAVWQWQKPGEIPCARRFKVILIKQPRDINTAKNMFSIDETKLWEKIEECQREMVE